MELRARDLEGQGVPRDEAWARARAAFGEAGTIERACREFQNQIYRRKRRTMTIDDIRSDFRWALRSLLRAPGFTVFAVLTLALGIAANTSIFSVANGIFFRSLPGVRDPGTLVEVSQGPGFISVSYPMYEHFRDNAPGLEALAAFDIVGMAVAVGQAQPEVVMGLQVSGNYFEVLGTRPAVGRFFAASERTLTSGASVAVIGHEMWMRMFDGDPGAVGATLRVNGETATVIGVAEEGFNGHVAPAVAEVFMPLGSPVPGFHDASLRNVGSAVIELVGRVAEGTDPDGLAQRLTDLALARLAAEGAEPPRYMAEVRAYAPVPGTMRGPAGIFFAILSVLVGLLLVISCLNVAGLLMSRSVGRRRELAIRLSLGAARSRLVRQLMSESLVLSALAGTLGVLLTYWLTGLLSAFQLPVTPLPGLRLDLHVTPDGTVLLYSLGLVVGVAVIFGLAPALRATKEDLVSDLKDAVGSGTPPRNRTRGLLVGTQMAMTIVLLIGSGLFLRALVSAETLDPGFDTDGVYVAFVDLEMAGRTPEEAWSFFSELRRRAIEIPGVEAASLAAKLPLGGLSQISPVNFEGVETPEGAEGFILANQTVGPDYLRTLGIPLLEGRDFAASDDGSSPRVVIVNQALADRMWPGRSPLGRHVMIGAADDLVTWEVVGVAATAKYSSLGEEPRSFAYFPAGQRPRTDMILHVRSSPGSAAPLTEIRPLASRLDPAAAVHSLNSLESAMGIFVLPQRVGAWVTGIMGLFGLLLGGIGVYALTAFWVTRNLRGIAIRMALGAGRPAVLRDVLRKGLAAPAIGALAGLALAVMTSRFLGAFLLGVDPLDVITFAGVVGILGSVSILANVAPALRATRLDLSGVLRED
jgi:predicted permease